MNLSLVGRIPLSINVDIGVSNLTDREAMGLPKFYKASQLDTDCAKWYDKLLKFNAARLAEIAEDTDSIFLKRYTAGCLLNLKGDPRIRLFNPLMVDIPSWEGHLGPNPDKVDEIVKQYRSIGVLRNWIEKETPQYWVRIESFRISKYPVTNKEYLEFLIDTKYPEIPNSWKFGQYPHLFGNHPVYTISCEAACDYCKWFTEKTGKTYRLPSEAEWEYAASGKDNLEFPWGNQFKRDHANTAETGIFQSTPVGIFPKGNSPFGCSDMGGNVEEYTADLYNSYDNKKPVIDDLVETNGIYQVARGGSFTRFRDLVRCKRRHGANPKEIYVMGFRIVQQIN